MSTWLGTFQQTPNNALGIRLLALLLLRARAQQFGRPLQTSHFVTRGDTLNLRPFQDQAPQRAQADNLSWLTVATLLKTLKPEPTATVKNTAVIPAPIPTPVRAQKNPNAKANIVLEGDSLTDTRQAGAYSHHMAGLFPNKNATFHYRGKGGDQLRAGIKNDVAGNNSLFDKNSPNNVMVLWGGTNDLYYGASAEDSYKQLTSLVDQYKAKDWKVVVLTSIQRTGSAKEDAERQAFNRKLRQDGGNWDSLVDVAHLPEFSDTTNGVENNKAIYIDGVHLTRQGSKLIADKVQRAIQNVLD
jgi:lysophospholipase L1-like esterase